MTLPQRIATLCGRANRDLTPNELIAVDQFYRSRLDHVLPLSMAHTKLLCAIDNVGVEIDHRISLAAFDAQPTELEL